MALQMRVRIYPAPAASRTGRTARPQVYVRSRHEPRGGDSEPALDWTERRDGERKRPLIGRGPLVPEFEATKPRAAGPEEGRSTARGSPPRQSPSRYS